MNETDYNIALARIEVLVDMDPLEGTSEAFLLDILTSQVKKYEDEKYPEDELFNKLEQLNCRQFGDGWKGAVWKRI